ncbi:hypothetical protein Esi_0042_0101 [Ectocarpus siliculosus]|uniref:Uncharacterized protein n=1 Tax=Ectocarpus siliculosus TaxID=2880 RepID=D7G0Y7_ECTSI|nr:hypothetical protein Esi_0042_0101 [Ectocarpus siliculosus]|eukprot:CBJ26731.1 hypothetical protein Esi_0042_0101 [Ectocarpus siliculosus]
MQKEQQPRQVDNNPPLDSAKAPPSRPTIETDEQANSMPRASTNKAIDEDIKTPRNPSPSRDTHPDREAIPETNPSTTTKRRLSTDAELHKLPEAVVSSCDQLHSPLMAAYGVVRVTGDIICEEKRVIQVKEEAILITEKPNLVTKGVHFRVRKDAALRISVRQMSIENIKGDTSPLLRVDPGGLLRLEIHDFGTPPEGGTMTDTNSRVRIEEGGEVQVWGEPWFTKSAITLMKPFKKEPSWILNNMRRNHAHWQRQRWNRQQQQKMTGGQHAGGGTTGKPQPPFCSPFGPKISEGYSFWERFDISPSYLKVGEELRYPSSMTSLMDGSVLSMGADGTLLHATADRRTHFHLEMKTAVEAAEAASDLEEHARKTKSVPDITADGVDPDNKRLQLQTLVAADPAKAMAALMGRPGTTVGGGPTWAADEEFDATLRREWSRMRDTLLGRTANGQAEEKKGGLGQSPPTKTDEADGSGDNGDPRQHKETGGVTGGTSSKKETGNAADNGLTDPDINNTGNTCGRASRRRMPWGRKRMKWNAEVAVDSDGPLPYWGDGTVLKVTETGDVVVSIAGEIVIEMANPRKAKKGGWFRNHVRKHNPIRKVGDAFRRHLHSRRKGSSNSDPSDSVHDTDTIVSTDYSLHVVEKGFEVRLEGEFVWGWYTDSIGRPL